MEWPTALFEPGLPLISGLEAAMSVAAFVVGLRVSYFADASGSATIALVPMPAASKP